VRAHRLGDGQMKFRQRALVAADPERGSTARCGSAPSHRCRFDVTDVRTADAAGIQMCTLRTPDVVFCPECIDSRLRWNLTMCALPAHDSQPIVRAPLH
jgi:hypothetical protein